MNSLVSTVQEQSMEECQGLVRSLAINVHRTLPRNIDLDDLIAYGQVGLVEAARDFDASRGVRFATFAYYRIRGAIYDGLARMTGMSRGHYQQVRSERMSNAVLEASSQTSSDDSEKDLTWLRDVGKALAMIQLVSDVDVSESKLEDSLVDPARFGPLALVMKRELTQRVMEMIEQLPENEASLIRGAYFEDLTLEAAGQRIGISKSWATRLHASALRHLALRLKGEGA